MAELRTVLERPKFAARLRDRAVVLDDPDDDMVLATAVAANADGIVSGESRAKLHAEVRASIHPGTMIAPKGVTVEPPHQLRNPLLHPTGIADARHLANPPGANRRG